jgi:hypothetical protein
MNVLVDTSAWVAHFRASDPVLTKLLLMDEAMIHPMVLLELACGTPPQPRKKTLGDIALLRSAQQASHGEVMDFIEREKLYGLGCGLVDLSLLASALITPDASLWTLDKRLDALAARFGVRFQSNLH